MLRLLLALSLLTLTAPAFAQVPGRIPLHGRLVDTDGDPVEGTLSVHAELFADSGGATLLWAETQDVEFSDGAFTLVLGATAPVDTRILRDDASVFVGITLGDDARMPLFPLTAVPYAAFAQYAGDAQTLAGLGPEAFAPSDHRHDYTDIDGAPAGDADTLGGLSCADGQVARRQSGAWVCSDAGGGNATAGTGITVDGGTVSVDAGWADARYVNEGQADSVSAGMIAVDAVGRDESRGAEPQVYIMNPGCSIVGFCTGGCTDAGLLSLSATCQTAYCGVNGSSASVYLRCGETVCDTVAGPTAPQSCPNTTTGFLLAQ